MGTRTTPPHPLLTQLSLVNVDFLGTSETVFVTKREQFDVSFQDTVFERVCTVRTGLYTVHL